MRTPSEYAIYKGDEVQVVGTLQQCADAMEVSTATIEYYASPAHHRKIAQVKNPGEHQTLAVRVEKDKGASDE